MRSGGLTAEIRGGRGDVPPAENKGYRGVVPMKYQSTSTVLLLLPTKYPSIFPYFWQYQRGASVSLILAGL